MLAAVGISDEQSYNGLCCLQLSGFFGDSVNCTIYLNKSFLFLNGGIILQFSHIFLPEIIWSTSCSMHSPFLYIKNIPQIPVIAGVENIPPSKAPINRHDAKNDNKNVCTNLLFLTDSSNVIKSIGSKIITNFATSGMYAYRPTPVLISLSMNGPIILVMTSPKMDFNK